MEENRQTERSRRKVAFLVLLNRCFVWRYFLAHEVGGSSDLKLIKNEERDKECRDSLKVALEFEDKLECALVLLMNEDGEVVINHSGLSVSDLCFLLKTLDGYVLEYV